MTEIQNSVVSALSKKGFRFDREISGNEPETVAVLMSKKVKSYSTRYAEVESDGTVNGQTLSAFLASF